MHVKEFGNKRRVQCFGVLLFLTGCLVPVYFRNNYSLDIIQEQLQTPPSFHGVLRPYSNNSATLTVDNKRLFGAASNETLETTVEEFIGTIEESEEYNETQMNADRVTPIVSDNVTSERQHIAFLKVHKAASTTLQTMFFKYGYQRNLSFVLPVTGNYISKSTTDYRDLIPPLHGDHYDIVCNHACFNYTEYSKIMPRDTIYIATVRDPFKQFISAFNYYTTVYQWSYLMKIPEDRITNLIYYSEKYDTKLSYTMNSMSRDFGFTQRHFDDTSNMAANAYLQHLDTVFDLVLVAEHIDESLIMMKRRLNWSLKDILYISKNIRGTEMEVDGKTMRVFRKRNRLDYLLYDYFKKIFLKRKAKAGPSLQEEAKNFKHILSIVQTWCNDPDHEGFLNINGTFWNDPFTVTSHDCELLSMPELKFIEFLKDTK